ncbi:Permease of the drug/metabolite transporter (DMT) superfamily [Azotobacter beijerinckii]|uniref:Permease of the drug/metabolite transporter (DMT) superfamily n=2 Tax=Azotobacter beijerinckii TaxID=170623 RepID=A0A1H9IM46_9GAMM|nr:DMT family transporter [Azotobacter beijerinckii]SEQ75562.1 Permease of the drug/metabolite transporter (DMT) superfamily [Azotobacter beijerinckii]
MHNAEHNSERPLLGIGQIVLATALFAGHDTLSKHLGGIYPVVMVVWARYAVHSLLMLGLFAPRHGRALLRSRRPGLQLARALCLLGSSLLFTAGLRFIPLAEATAVNFLAPLLVAALSAPLLGERVTPAQWLAVGVSFVGILCIVRPGSELFDPAILLTMGSACCFAGYHLITRKLSGIDDARTSNCLTGLLNCLALSALLPFFWTTPRLEHALLALGMGSFAMLGHLLLTHAYRHAAPTLLAPFSYAQIVFAGLVGYLLFGNLPDAFAQLGMALICASGLAMAHLQRLAPPAPRLRERTT